MSLLDEETAHKLLCTLNEGIIPTNITQGFTPYESTKEDWINMPQAIPKWLFQNQTNISKLQKTIIDHLSIEQLSKDNTNIYAMITVKLS